MTAPAADGEASARPAPRPRADLLAGAAVASAGIVLLVAALAIPEPPRVSPGMGPELLPTAVSVGLLVCGVLLILASRRSAPTAATGVAPERGDRRGREPDLLDPEGLLDDVGPPVPWRGLAVVAGLTVAYALVFEGLGFPVATALFLMALTTYVERQRWLRNAIFAVVFAVAVYVLFTQVLSVVLPAGLIGRL